MTRPKPLPCPACGSTLSKVIEARDEPRLVRDQLHWTGIGFWRRRRCSACGRTFTTSETVAALDEETPAKETPSAVYI